MLNISDNEFEQLVEEEFDLLPDEMLDKLDNVIFVIEDHSKDEELFGLYDGVPVTERNDYGQGNLPDRIIIYRKAHLDAAHSMTDLRSEIHRTLVHEIGHYYGLDDHRLHELGWA